MFSGGEAWIGWLFLLVLVAVAAFVLGYFILGANP